MKKRNRWIIALLSALMLLDISVCVFAEESDHGSSGITLPSELTQPIPDLSGIETSHITLRCFDDSEETVPCTGAEYTVLQVGTIGRDVDDNGRFLPLTEQLEWSDATDPIAYEQMVYEAYESDPDLGYVETQRIGESGTASYLNIPCGVYLISQTVTTRYHLRSTPFLVTTPEMNEDGTSWCLSVVANPKQMLAGDLEVEKIVKGSILEKDNIYHMQIDLNCDGEYRLVMPDGSESVFVSGDVIGLKKGEKAVICDLPSGVQYSITEKEANKGWHTQIRNQQGIIQAKQAILCTVINDSTSVDTGVDLLPTHWLIACIASVCLVTFWVLIRLGEKDDEEDDETLHKM